MSSQKTAYRFEVRLLPEAGEETDSDWQEECSQLVRRVRDEVEGLEVDVVPTTGDLELGQGEQARSVDALTFSTFVMLALSPGVIQALVERFSDAVSGWMQRRKGCRCVIKTPDGSEFAFENLSKEELLTFMREHASEEPATPQEVWPVV